MLTQAEADALIAMPKRFVNPCTISLSPGVHALIGDDRRERFQLDLWRGIMRLSKYRMRTRGRIIVVLQGLHLLISADFVMLGRFLHTRGCYFESTGVS